jgi:hypothetical protein
MLQQKKSNATINYPFQKEYSMSKQTFLKRCGQLYALNIQHGITEEELMKYIEESFTYLYKNKVIKNDDTKTKPAT